MHLRLLSNLSTSSLHDHNPLCIFAQINERLQAPEVEQCSSCDIEILNVKPPLNETTTQPLNTLPSPGSSPSTSSPSCVLLPADYCPQSGLCGRPAHQQMICVTNKSYLSTVEEDLTEKQGIISENTEPSESLQESCSVVFGYISNDTF